MFSIISAEGGESMVRYGIWHSMACSSGKTWSDSYNMDDHDDTSHEAFSYYSSSDDPPLRIILDYLSNCT